MKNIELNVGRSEPPDLLFKTQRIKVLESLQNTGGLSSKCVTALAPVGYGKTVLMTMLMSDLRHIGKQCVWLTLDERDTSIEALITELAVALQSDGSVLHPTHALLRGHDSAEKTINSLIGLLSSYPLPIIIFIDNLQCCRDQDLGQLLDQLLFKTRSTVQLVLSSTQELPIDFPSAQLAGLIRCVSSKELSFSADEVEEFLGGDLSKKLGGTGIAEVVRKTEGWPAAVRMAQIILANAGNPLQALETFSGSDEALAQLLNRQVISGFPVKVRNFLLALSQLRTFCVDLCNEAIGGDDVRECLAYLIERNVFIIPLDRNREWYRLHGLFREHLLREAETALPLKGRQNILMRAVHWCDPNDFNREAIDYAFASGSIATAIPILERIAPSFVRNRGAALQYIDWINTIHKTDQQASLEAEYWYVWALAFYRRYEQARQQMIKLTKRMEQEKSSDSEFQRRMAILQASIYSLTDRLESAHAEASQWLTEVDAEGFDAFDMAAAYCIESSYYTHTFRFVEARRVLQSAREAAFQANSVYVDGWVSSYAALIGIYEGSYGAAYSELVSALTSIRGRLGDDSGICGTMALIAANCAVKMGLDSEAKQLLPLGMKTWRTHGFLDAVACGIEAVLLLWSGAEDEQVTLAELRRLAGAYPWRLSLMLSCFLMRRLLVLGRAEEARVEADAVGLLHNIDGLYERTRALRYGAQLNTLIALTNIELIVSSGKYRQAMPLIESELVLAKQTSCYVNTVALELNSAEISLKVQNHTDAVRHVTRAIRIAASRRILKPFHDHMTMLSTLIQESKVSVWGFATEEERQFFTEICRKLSASIQDRAHQLSVLQDPACLLGNLTAREHELLELIDAGLSNQQLADHVDVSLATVKWHLQNLYAKLGVSRRTAAVAKARALNLLTR